MPPRAPSSRALPIVNTIRQALLVAWPAGYVPVLAGVVAVTGLALVVFTLRSMRDRSWPRLAALAMAVALAVGSGAALRTGVANVDAVEAFHFVGVQRADAAVCLGLHAAGWSIGLVVGGVRGAARRRGGRVDAVVRAGPHR